MKLNTTLKRRKIKAEKRHEKKKKKEEEEEKKKKKKKKKKKTLCHILQETVRPIKSFLCMVPILKRLNANSF